jgi:hypothetical protein
MSSRGQLLKALARTSRFKESAPTQVQLAKPAMVADFGLDPRFQQQNAFIMDPSRFIDAQCSRRAGKSSGLAIRFFKTMNRYPGSTSRYLALTGDSARDIMWPVLEELDEKYKIGLKFIPSRLTVVSPSGGKLRLYGADMKNFIRRLRGNKAPAIAVDEAQEFGSHLEYLVDDILTPMLVDFGEAAWLAITGSPGPVPNGYFFDVTQLKKYGYSHHEWTLLDNPHLPNPEQFLADLIARKQWDANHPTLLREWRNKWVVDLESLWIKYKADRNDFTELPAHIKKWNYILGIDIGWKDADAFAVLAWSENSAVTYLVEEIVTHKQDITGLRIAIESLHKRFGFHKMVMDTGGLGKKVAEELKARYGLPIEAADKARKQENAEILNDSLRLGNFRAHKELRFAQDTYLIQVDWDKSTPDRIVIKKNPHSDIIDAVLYAFKESPAYHYKEPDVQPKPGTAEYDKLQESQHEKAAIERVQRDQMQKKGEDLLNWNKDKKGIPDWNKW